MLRVTISCYLSVCSMFALVYVLLHLFSLSFILLNTVHIMSFICIHCINIDICTSFLFLLLHSTTCHLLRCIWQSRRGACVIHYYIWKTSVWLCLLVHLPECADMIVLQVLLLPLSSLLVWCGLSSLTQTLFLL